MTLPRSFRLAFVSLCLVLLVAGCQGSKTGRTKTAVYASDSNLIVASSELSKMATTYYHRVSPGYDYTSHEGVWRAHGQSFPGPRSP